MLIEGGRKPRPGDLILSRNATVGEVAQVAEWHPPFAMGQDVCLLRKKSNEHSTEFLQSIFQSPVILKQLTDLMVGSTLKRANVQQIPNLAVPMPPPPEQRAIATALSDVDALLGALDRLIAKKRDLKQAAMQQLLTGQTRLPGFTGEWEVKKLGASISLFSGHHILAHHCNTDANGVPYITGPADFPDGRVVVTKYTTSPSTMCERDDILVTVKGSGSGTIVMADDAYCISRQLMAIRVGDINGRFVYFSLLQNADTFRTASTGLIPGLSRSDILDLLLPMPPTLAEQTAIASVLSDMGAELSALEQRLAKTRALKQGMMQELLTGKTRLISFPEES